MRVQRTREEWMTLARQGAQELYRLGATRVWLFGSLAKNRRLDERSDIDLAVEGLPEGRYFRALGELLDRLPCPVDLVAWEEAPERLKRVIESERVLLQHED